MGKECHAANSGKVKCQNVKQWRQQVKLHKTHKNKQKKAEEGNQSQNVK